MLNTVFCFFTTLLLINVNGQSNACDSDTVLRESNRFVDTYNSGNVNVAASLFSPKGVIQPPFSGGSFIEGKSVVRNFLSSQFASGLEYMVIKKEQKAICLSDSLFLFYSTIQYKHKYGSPVPTSMNIVGQIVKAPNGENTILIDYVSIGSN